MNYPNDGRGVIYVLTNRDKSLAKIGFTTTGSAAERATAYSRESGIEFVVYGEMPTRYAQAVEAKAHAHFAGRRFVVGNCREVFHVTPAEGD
jgi:hypothetical protein